MSARRKPAFDDSAFEAETDRIEAQIRAAMDAQMKRAVEAMDRRDAAAAEAAERAARRIH